MRGFAVALGVGREFFEDKMRDPGCMARMVHYPPQPVGRVLDGIAVHTVGTLFGFVSFPLSL